MDVIDQKEIIIDCIRRKIRLLEARWNEVRVFEDVLNVQTDESNRVISSKRKEIESKRNGCASDLAVILAIREKIEKVEEEANKRSAKDEVSIQSFLGRNTDELTAAWGQLAQSLEKVRQLENNRQQELKRFVQKKEVEERRKTEFQQFLKVNTEVADKLENTIRNHNIFLHCLQLVEQAVQGITDAFGRDLRHRSNVHKELLLISHQQHLEVYRDLYLTVGEVLYRKGRAVEVVEQSVEQATEHQELCMGAFDPKAKRYHDEKVQLVEHQLSLQKQMDELKKRRLVAENEFKPTALFLRENGIAFQDPEEEYHKLSLAYKTKMLSYKAIVEGHSSDMLTSIQQILEETTGVRAGDVGVKMCRPASSRVNDKRKTNSILADSQKMLIEISRSQPG